MFNFFLSLWLMLLLASAAPAQESRAYPTVEPLTGISFPQALGPLKRKGLKKYSLPELGISYRYAADPLPIADIYIYDNGVKDLETGLKKAVRTHFEEVKNEIYLLENSGYYRSVKKVSEGDTALLTPGRKLPMLAAVFNYSVPARKGVAYTGVRSSHIFLTAYKGQFLKIQFTYPKNQEWQGKRALQQFLADFGKALNNKRLINRKTRNNQKTSRKKNIKSRTASH